MVFQCYNCFQQYTTKEDAATCCVLLSPDGVLVDLEGDPIYKDEQVVNGFMEVLE